MKKWLFLLAGLSALLASIVLSPTTSAVSVYDNYLNLISPDALEVRQFSPATVYTISTHDMGQLLVTKPCSNSALSDLVIDALENGNDYLIRQNYSSGVSSYPSLIIDIIGEGLGNVVWNNFPGYPAYDNIEIQYLSPYTDRVMIVNFQTQSGGVQPFCSWSTGSQATISSPTGYPKLAEYRGFSLDYPQDYEGETLDPVSVSKDVSNYIPNFIVHDNFTLVEPWKVQISDQNFFTFDNPAFLCSDDLAPVIRYQIKDEFDNILATDAISATAPIVYDFPIFSSVRSYTISGAYDCGLGVFPNNGHYTFNINAQGSLVNASNFSACVSEEFPWVHMNNCLENFYTVINMLTFKQITLGNVWEFQTTDCRYLVVLNGWLGVPSQVCPMFPPYIRNVVTPFVTFLLGLLSLQLINRIRREGS